MLNTTAPAHEYFIDFENFRADKSAYQEILSAKLASLSPPKGRRQENDTIDTHQGRSSPAQ
jgi:hypothetical protein